MKETIKSERNIRLSVVTLRVSLKHTLRRSRQLSLGRGLFHPMGGNTICPLFRFCIRVGRSIRHKESPPSRRPRLSITNIMRHMMDKGHHASGR